MYYPRLKDLRVTVPMQEGQEFSALTLEGQFLGLGTTPKTRLCLSKSTVVGTEVFNQCILCIIK